jgi:Sfi1 spindle body protein
LTSASRHHDLALLHSALGKWNRRLYRIVDLSQRGEELAKHADSVILERAFGAWKRRVHFNVASKIIQERVGGRVASNALVLWRQKTYVQVKSLNPLLNFGIGMSTLSRLDLTTPESCEKRCRNGFADGQESK